MDGAVSQGQGGRASWGAGSCGLCLWSIQKHSNSQPHASRSAFLACLPSVLAATRCAHSVGANNPPRSPGSEYISTRGAEHVTHEDIVREVKPQSRAKVPDSLKAELLRRIRGVLEG